MGQLIPITDERWMTTLLHTEHDFYHLPCYVELASSLDYGKPMAFFDEQKTGRLLIPLLIRDIPSEVFANRGWLDATSPYGYPGPLFSQGISAADAVKAVENFIQCGKDAGLVTTFLRLHPFISNNIWSALSGDYEHITVVSQGATVSIDLTLETEELDRQLRTNHQRNIKRLYQSGFTTRLDAWEDYPEFIDMYHETMRRRDAKSFYFFGRDYFARLRECLGDSLHIFSVNSPEGDMAASGIFVKTGLVVQAHLNATADKYLSLAPSKLMFFEMRNWAKQLGARIMHLGGGVGGQQDSLYLYKRGLGTHEHWFETIGIIHDIEAYKHLHERWAYTDRLPSIPDYFPFYRSLVHAGG